MPPSDARLILSQRAKARYSLSRIGLLNWPFQFVKWLLAKEWDTVQDKTYQILEQIHILVEGQLANSHWLNRYQSADHNTPDITIRFVDKLPIQEPVKYIDLKKTGYTDVGYVMLTNDVPPGKVLIPLEKLGQSFTIWCEKRVSSIPDLELFIHFSALTKSNLPLHASSFALKIRPGWPQAGRMVARHRCCLPSLNKGLNLSQMTGHTSHMKAR